MLCSIVIPLYNKAAFIEDTLRSLLAQRYPEFEVIVVDDGSKDDGAERVRKFSDPRIRLYEQENGGVSRARNRGIAMASGELVCFLDADDGYHPQYLETVVAMASSCPQAAYFATGYRCVGQLDEVLPTANDVSGMEAFELISDCFDRRRRCGAIFFTGSVSVRRDLLTKLQPCFPPGEAMGEDLDLWFRLAACSPLVYCPAHLAAYRVGVEHSLTAIHTIRELLPAWRRLEENALSDRLPAALRRSALRLVAHERIMLARVSLTDGRRSAALKQLFRARKGTSLSNWWVTLALALGTTPSAMQRWQRWRQVRTNA